jgi:glucose-1-phosphatase
MSSIKNIILDLGGVILDIDHQRPVAAFAQLGIADFSTRYNQFAANNLFEQLETGDISEPEFYDTFIEAVQLPLSHQQVKNAWNSILVGFPPERIHFLARLRERYRLFLLSNTNAVHHQQFQQMFREAFEGKELDDCFEQAFYSHQIHLRKPNIEIYRVVLEANSLNPAETLFIDDSIQNIQPATDLGIRVIHLQAPQQLVELPL